MVYFLKIYAVLVPFALFSLYRDSLINFKTADLSLGGAGVLLAKYGWLVGVAVVVNLAYLVISFWVNAAGIKAVVGVVNGENLNVKDTLGFAWKKLWMFSLLSLLVGLITGLGFILLIVPGILCLVWFHFSAFEFMTKEVGIKAAMGNSKTLITGRFWKVFGRFIVFGLFGILVQMVLSIIPLNIGNVILSLFGALFILPYFLLYKELSGSGSATV